VQYTMKNKDDAYFLGWVVSDGSVIIPKNRPSSRYLQITTIDIDQLSWVKEEYGGRISKRKKYSDTHSDCYDWKLYDTEFCLSLAEYSVHPKKTWRPCIHDPGKELFPYMLCGIIDGDGHYYKNQIAMHIRSFSEQWLKDLNNMIKEYIGVVGTVKYSGQSYRAYYSKNATMNIYLSFRDYSHMFDRKKHTMENHISSNGGLDNMTRKCKKCGKGFFKTRSKSFYCKDCQDRV